MDVVYVIGTGSKWDNNELRYSLRSIAMYGYGLKNVFVVGDSKPEFLSKDVVFVQAHDIIKECPAINVAWKLHRLYEVYSTLVGDFLLSSDDHFFIKPVDFDHWPVHYKGLKMPDYGTKGVGDRRYTQTMIDTHTLMKQLGLDTKYYEGHTNKIYMRDVWEEVWWHHDKEVMDAMMNGHYGVSLNSLMAAMTMKLHPNYPCVYRNDVKLRHLNTPEDWDALRETESFSIYDSAIKTGVQEFLETRFYEPCRFEKI